MIDLLCLIGGLATMLVLLVAVVALCELPTTWATWRRSRRNRLGMVRERAWLSGMSSRHFRDRLTR